MADQRWLYVYCYRLTLDNALHAGVTDNSLPVAVYHQKRNALIQLNRAARAAGIEQDMGLAQAAALCENLELIDYDESMELSLLKNLASQLYECVAEISVSPPDGLAIRIDNLVRYYGSYEQIWEAVKAVILSRNIRCHYASAWSPDAARVLARQQTNILLLENASIRRALNELPVSSLLLSQKESHALYRAGIKHLGALFELPATEIGKRFNSDLLKYLFSLKGDSYRAGPFYHPPATFEQTVILPFEVTGTDKLNVYLSKILKDLAIFLRLRNAGTQWLILTLCYRETDPVTLDIRKSDLRFSFDEWANLIALKLETTELAEPVIQFTLCAGEINEYAGKEADFFNARKHFFARQQLLSKLTARLGNQAVSDAGWPEDHRFTMAKASRSHACSEQAAQHIPAFILSQPQRLTGTPKIEFGPVRIENGWWDNAPEQRDYFIALNQHGQRMQIFREQGGWYISGWYA